MPLSLHGDAGTFTKSGESVVVVSWSSLLLKGPTWHSIFLAFAIPKNALVRGSDGDTLQVLCTHLAADLAGLFYMTHPPKDGLGQDWRDGSEAAAVAGQGFVAKKRAVVFLLCGDLDWYCNYLGVNRHFNSNEPCWLCDANRSSRPWTDFSPDAAWRATVYDTEQGHANDISPHPFLHLPGISRFSLCVDVMHTVCLGVASLAVGSALYSLVLARAGRESQAACLQKLFAEIKELYAEMGTTNKLTNLRVTMIKKPGEFAELSSRAAEARALVPVVARLCKAR
eukprot:1502296-Alexandrium_andersonii.AAC.1